ncbi:hypothetical protein HK096_007633, partial [Nowakowskiella sp. JEL0078]
MSIFGKNFILIQDPNAIKSILNNLKDFNRNSRLIKGFEGLSEYLLPFMIDGDTWRKHRKGIQPAFGPIHLKEGFSVSLDLINKLSEFWLECLERGEDTREVTKDIRMLIGDIISTITTGYGQNAIELLRYGKTSEIFELLDENLKVFITRFYLIDVKWTWPFFGISVKNLKPKTSRIHSILQVYIDQKRSELEQLHTNEKDISFSEHWKKNLLDRLLSPSLGLDGKPSWLFSNDEIMGEMITFFNAGVDTSSSTLSFIIWELCKNRNIQLKLRNEIDSSLSGRSPTMETLTSLKYLNAVFKETLRMHTIVSNNYRTAYEDSIITTTDGLSVKIPKGTEVVINYAESHRDKNFWGENAEEFFPERWMTGDIPKTQGSFLPFGDGPFNCVGQKLAEITIKVTIIRIIQNFELILSDRNKPIEKYLGILTLSDLL